MKKETQTGKSLNKFQGLAKLQIFFFLFFFSKRYKQSEGYCWFISWLTGWLVGWLIGLVLLPYNSVNILQRNKKIIIIKIQKIQKILKIFSILNGNKQLIIYDSWFFIVIVFVICNATIKKKKENWFVCLFVQLIRYFMHKIKQNKREKCLRLLAAGSCKRAHAVYMEESYWNRCKNLISFFFLILF